MFYVIVRTDITKDHPYMCGLFPCMVFNFSSKINAKAFAMKNQGFMYDHFPDERRLASLGFYW